MNSLKFTEENFEALVFENRKLRMFLNGCNKHPNWKGDACVGCLEEDHRRLTDIEDARLSIACAISGDWYVQDAAQIVGCLGRASTLREAIDKALKYLDQKQEG